MTITDLKLMKDTVVTPAVAAQLLGCDPHYIRIAARTNPEWLGFPVILIGNRVKIPRLPLISYLEHGRVRQ